MSSFAQALLVYVFVAFMTSVLYNAVLRVTPLEEGDVSIWEAIVMGVAAMLWPLTLPFFGAVWLADVMRRSRARRRGDMS